MDFYDRLKALIEKEDLTIAAFEQKMKFSNSSLAKAIRQKKGITSDRLENIFAIYTHWSIEFLFRGNGEMHILSEKEKLLRQSEIIQAAVKQSTEDLRITISAYERALTASELLRETQAKLGDNKSDHGKSNDKGSSKSQ